MGGGAGGDRAAGRPRLGGAHRARHVPTRRRRRCSSSAPWRRPAYRRTSSSTASRSRAPSPAQPDQWAGDSVASLAHQAAAPPRPRWSLAPRLSAASRRPKAGRASSCWPSCCWRPPGRSRRTDVAPDGDEHDHARHRRSAYRADPGQGLCARISLAHLCGLLSGRHRVAGAGRRADAARPGGTLGALASAGRPGRRLAGAGAGRRAARRPRLLAIMLGAAVWLVSYTAAWVLFRRGWLTTALALPVVIALANLGYAPEEGTLPLLVIVRGGDAARRAPRGLPPPGRVVARPAALSARARSPASCSAASSSPCWSPPSPGRCPMSSTRDSLFGGAWDRISEPLAEVGERWNELLARFGGPGRRPAAAPTPPSARASASAAICNCRMTR